MCIVSGITMFRSSTVLVVLICGVRLGWRSHTSVDSGGSSGTRVCVVVAICRLL